MLKKYAFFLFLFFACTVYSQDSLDYRVDLFGSVSTGKYTPFLDNIQYLRNRSPATE